jgi:cyclopropane fatty-acyl-phospholipid synthase-like methyltransferase
VIAPARAWDAATYHRVSGPQVAMAGAVLDRLQLVGDETVLDAGCGSGRVTAAAGAAAAMRARHRRRRVGR